MATRKLTDEKTQRLGDALRAHREQAGMSQPELARETGMHRTSIGDIEVGRSGISLASLVRIAEALNVEASEIIHDAAL